MDTAKPGLLQSAKEAVVRSIKEFDVLFAMLFATAYMSPTLSSLLRVNTVKTTVVLFGLWVLSFCINTFIVKRREGGVIQFVKDIFANKRIWELLLFVGWMVLLAANTLVGRGVNGHIAFSYYSIFIAVMLLDYSYSITKEGWKTKYIIYVLLFVFAVEYIRGSIAIIQYYENGPWISRQLSTGLYTDAERRAFMMQGIGGYEVNTGMSIMTGVFLLYILKAKRRLPMVLMLLVCMFGIFISSYTFPVMFACFTLLIAAIYSWIRASKEGHDRKIIPRVMLAVVALFSLLLVFSTPLDIYPARIYADKASYVYRHEVRDRVRALLGMEIKPDEEAEETRLDFVIEQVITEAEMGDVDATGLGMIATRMLLYKQSWVTFSKNWAFGVGPVVNEKVKGVGGHSTWADYFATFGLLQFSFFVGYMLCMLVRIIRSTRGMERFYRVLAYFIFVAYAFINPVISHKVFPIVLCLMIGGNMPDEGYGYIGDFKPLKARSKRAIAMPAPAENEAVVSTTVDEAPESV